MTFLWAVCAWLGETVQLCLVLGALVLCVGIWKHSDELETPLFEISGNRICLFEGKRKPKRKPKADAAKTFEYEWEESKR